MKNLALIMIFFAFGACSSSKKEKSVMEPTHGESIKTFSKASGTSPRDVSSKKPKDSRSLASEQENREACYKGDLDACAYIGKFHYEKGNIKRATNFLTKSCDGGNPLGCYHLGWLQKERGNLEAAEINFRKSCDGGYFQGCVDLGHLAKDTGNLDEAADSYGRACEGYIPACGLLGDVEEKRGNLDKAMAAYELRCNGGEDIRTCMKVMGSEREKGNYREVESLYRRVCVEREFEEENDFHECFNFVLQPNGMFTQSYDDEPPRVRLSRPCFRGNPRKALDRRRYEKCIHIKNMMEMRDKVQRKTKK